MRYLTISLLLVAGTFLTIGNTQAQDTKTKKQNKEMKPKKSKQKAAGPKTTDKVTDAELEKFVNVANRVSQVQQEYNKKKQEAIESAGLTMNRYKQIMSIKNQPDKNDGTGIKKQEDAQFKEANTKIKRLREQEKEEINEAIEAHGLTQKRYKEIFMAIQNNQELRERYREMKN